jgi:hypothetical protein
LTREAEVDAVVAKAISGHATDATRVHYSTASDAEVQTRIARVISLAGFRRPAAAKQTTYKDEEAAAVRVHAPKPRTTTAWNPKDAEVKSVRIPSCTAWGERTNQPATLAMAKTAMSAAVV